MGKTTPLTNEKGEVRELSAADLRRFKPAHEVLPASLQKTLGRHKKNLKKVLPMASPTSLAIPTRSNSFSRCLCSAALRLQAAAGTFTHAAPYPVLNLFR